MIIQAQQAFSALAQQEQALNTVIDWQPLKCGSSNWLYRGKLDKSDYVLRINASDEFAFGVCRLREAKVLDLIQGQYWAVNVIENNVGQGWCLMKDHGKSLTAETVSATAVLQILANIHKFSQSVTEQTRAEISFDYPKLFSQYQLVFSTIGTSVANSEESELALNLSSQLSNSILQLPAVPSVLIHQDLHLKTFCQASSLVAIDWEYAGWGSPWLDVAALHTEFGLSALSLRQLRVFDGITEQSFQRGLQLASEINRALSCVWYWLRRFKNVQKEGMPDKTDLTQITREQLIEDTQWCLTALAKRH